MSELAKVVGAFVLVVGILGGSCDALKGSKTPNLRHKKLKDTFHFPNNILEFPRRDRRRDRHNVEFERGPLETIWGRKDESSLMGDEDDESEVITSSNDPPPSIRLPGEVTPIHYFLEVIPLLDNKTQSIGKIWTAPGNVKILVEAEKPEKTITMHALDLKISDVQVVNRNSGEKINITGHGYSKKIPDQYLVSLEEPLTVGERYEIGLNFVAPIVDAELQADGLYRSAYKDTVSNKTVYLVSTQFEFFSARQVFPCFDEPALKATFDISIGRSAKHTSLSNSNLVSTVPLLGTLGWYIDTYNTTVVMPTYVVAFVVSDYTYAEANSTILKDRPVRVYGPSSIIKDGGGDFGAEVSAKVLSFYENYFDSEYPMPKMDSAAIPKFQYGAMENYGLNVYREKLLLTTPHATQQQKDRIANVIAHESAHQYFGNLVTCKWWDNIWLNEGFATYYSYLGQNLTNPEFEPLKQLFTDSTQYAMGLDSRERSSYPLLLTATSQATLERQAVGLPYYKGAALIRMMNGFLTPETFHKGIKRYLKQWAYKAVDQDNLFEALTEQAHIDGTLPSDMNMKEIMDPWTKQRGYPLIRVISTDNDTIYVLYERFESVNMLKTDKLFSWPVPISYATENEPDFENTLPKFWIPQGKVLMTMKHNLSQWIVINPDATGFYRVTYDNKLTTMLQNQFDKDHKVISAMSRSQIMDDYFTLANQGDLPISSALEFTKHLRGESEEIVWTVFLRNVKQLTYFYSENQVDNSTSPTPTFQSFQKYIVPRLEGALQEIGVEQNPEEKGAKVAFRAKLLSFACRFGSNVCLGYANRLFQLWHTDPEVDPIPVDLNQFMYCYGVAAGGALNWLLAYQQYSNESSEFGGNPYLAKSLGCVKDQNYLTIILESLLDGSMQLDAPGIGNMFLGMIGNPVGRPVVLEFLKNHLRTFQAKFNETADEVLFHIVYHISDYLHTKEDLMQIQAALEPTKHLDGEDSFYPHYASDITDNINWISESFTPMKVWFDKQIERENLSAGA